VRISTDEFGGGSTNIQTIEKWERGRGQGAGGRNDPNVVCIYE
jgi:hypothetical protein